MNHDAINGISLVFVSYQEVKNTGRNLIHIKIGERGQSERVTYCSTTTMWPDGRQNMDTIKECVFPSGQRDR